MKRHFVIIVLTVFLAMLPVGLAVAANTVTSSTDTCIIELSVLDSDWTSSTKLRVYSIQFNPGAANDVLVMKADTDAGPPILYLKSGDGEPRIKYFSGAKLIPMLDYSACTISAGGTVIIHFGK